MTGGSRYTARALGSFGSVQELHELVIDERGLKLRPGTYLLSPEVRCRIGT